VVGLGALLVGAASPSPAQPVTAAATAARWHTGDNQVRVWIEPASDVRGWSPGYASAVRSAFLEWKRARTVTFRFVSESERSDIRVHWVSWFDEAGEPMSGRTVSVRDPAGRILQAGIEIAVHHSDGTRLSTEEVRALALHEIGHALGLDHLPDDDAVMSPTVTVQRLSAADIAAVRRLYARPASRARAGSR
jgi:predicted Zn-dependent protease